MKWLLTAEDARAIAVKLMANYEPGRARHEGVEFWHNGRVVVRFGIRRGSKDQGHNYIPRSMYLSQKDCRLFKQCDISVNRYVEMLREQRIIRD